MIKKILLLTLGLNLLFSWGPDSSYSGCSDLFSSPEAPTVKLWRGHELLLLTEREDIQTAVDIMHSNWATPTYGLEGIEHLGEDYVHKDHHLYFAAKNRDGDILTVMRLIPDTDLSRFPSLNQDLIDGVRGKKVMTLGVYQSAITSKRMRPLLLLKLWEFVLQFSREQKVGGLYAEVVQERISGIKILKFKPIGPKFSVDGWKRSYNPFLLELSPEEPVDSVH